MNKTPLARIFDQTPESRDWKEDWSHENGQYTNFCLDCRRQFVGHKRRIMCKDCHSRLGPQSAAAADDGGKK